jgi:hypothetical protein
VVDGYCFFFFNTTGYCLAGRWKGGGREIENVEISVTKVTTWTVWPEGAWC